MLNVFALYMFEDKIPFAINLRPLLCCKIKKIKICIVLEL